MSELIPTRRGRCAGMGSWQEQYRALQMTGDEAAALIRDDDEVAFAAMASWPREVDAALAKQLKARDGHINLHGHYIPPFAEIMKPEYARNVTYSSNFFGLERGLVASQGNVQFVPTNLSQTPAWLEARKPRVVALACTPPDENGWMSRSVWGTSVGRNVFEQCEVLLVEVHPELPVIASEGIFHTKLHVSEVDGIIPTGGPLPENPQAGGTETDKRIAGFVAEMVPDGACMQFGIGGLANAVGECLTYAGKKDLGVHTEVLSDCLMKLVQSGVVNNSRKTLFPGRIVGGHFVSTREMWEFARENPIFCQKEITFVNDPRNICQNDNVVSVNNAMEIDFSGQVNAETVGTRQYSGTGGQLEWVIGSQWSKGGKSIITLKSSYRDKQGVLHSKIKPVLGPGSIITTPRTMVQYVITEYGVADLKYKSTLERAHALINIAHPDFREELRRQLPW